MCSRPGIAGDRLSREGQSSLGREVLAIEDIGRLCVGGGFEEVEEGIVVDERERGLVAGCVDDVERPLDRAACERQIVFGKLVARHVDHALSGVFSHERLGGDHRDIDLVDAVFELEIGIGQRSAFFSLEAEAGIACDRELAKSHGIVDVLHVDRDDVDVAARTGSGAWLSFVVDRVGFDEAP